MVSLGRWHPAGDSCKVEVFGTKGTEPRGSSRPDDGDALFLHALRLQAEDFVRTVRTGDGTGATVLDALEALRVATVGRVRIRRPGAMTGNVRIITDEAPPAPRPESWGAS